MQVTAAAAHRPEDLFVKAVETYCDPMQARFGQLHRDRSQQHRIGRERQIFDTRQRREPLHKLRHFFVEQGFAARQAQFRNAQTCGDPRHFENLGMCQPLRPGQELVVVMKLSLRHAVRTAEIAAIQQRDTQVMQRPMQRIAGFTRCGLDYAFRARIGRHIRILPDLAPLFFILVPKSCMLFGRQRLRAAISMHVTFSDKELAFRDEVRAFFRDEMPEGIAKKQRQGVPLDRDDYIRFQKALYEKGWFGYNWPVEYGGTGWSVVQKFIFLTEMAQADAPVIIPFGLGMVGPVIYTFGTEEQKQRFLPDILASNVWWCQGYSEPGSGSDLASLKTRADRAGDYYIVNGTKTWTTLGQHADWIFCLVRTSTEVARRQEGISFLLIDMKTPGISVTPIITIEGDHEINEIHFEDVKVPVENLVGEEGKGWTYGKVLLEHERTGTAGVARTKYRLQKLREQAGRAIRGATPLSNDRNFMRKLAATEVELKALEFTELRTLAAVASGKAPGPESSILKFKGTELQQATDELYVEAAGYYALPYVPDQYVLDFPDADRVGEGAETKSSLRYFNFRKASIYGGSNEIQKNIVAKHVLGL